MNKENLADKLYEYFGMHDTYYYHLTRVKEAFSVGTVGIDDFEELDDEFIDDLADFIFDIINEKS